MIPKKGFRKIVVDGKLYYWKQVHGTATALADENRNFLGYFDHEIRNLPGDEYLTPDYDGLSPIDTPIRVAEAIRRRMYG